MDQPPARLPLAWTAYAAVAFDYGWSKNRMWAARRGTHARRLTDGAKARRAELAAELRRVIPVGGVRHNRLWLTVHVEKPDHKGDALNCLDLVADAVEDATGLDDRWFALGGLTWSIVKAGPLLRVWVGQEDVVDRLLCGACGMILPPDAFARNRSGKLGRAGTCRGCAAEARRIRSARRRELAENDQPPELEPRPGTRPPWLR